MDDALLNFQENGDVKTIGGHDMDMYRHNTKYRSVHTCTHRCQPKIQSPYALALQSHLWLFKAQRAFSISRVPIFVQRWRKCNENTEMSKNKTSTVTSRRWYFYRRKLREPQTRGGWCALPHCRTPNQQSSPLFLKYHIYTFGRWRSAALIQPKG
jgi:hypothetical protein